MSRERCIKELNSLYAAVQLKIKANSYSSLIEFYDDVDEVKRKYEENAKVSDIVVSDFKFLEFWNF
jgi:prephenate dehydrogenase